MEMNWLQMHKDATTVLEGEFPVVITEATATTSSTSKPMVKIVAVIESGQYAGRKLYSQFVISAESPQAMRMFFAHMSVLGLNEAFWSTNPTTETLAETLKNRRATAVVQGREYQGSMREGIEGWKPALGGPGGGVGGTLGGLVTADSTPLSQPAAAEPVQPALVEPGMQPSTPAPEPAF